MVRKARMDPYSHRRIMSPGKETFSSTAGAAKISESVQMTTWIPVKVKIMGIGLWRHFGKFCNVGSKLKASKIFRDFVNMQEMQSEAHAK